MKPPLKERVFHLPDPGPPLGEPLRLACVSRGQGREVWIQRDSRACFLEVHSGHPAAPEVQRIDISGPDFERLWNSGISHRVEVVRQSSEWNGQPVVIDFFPDRQSALARIAFHGAAQARRFRKPLQWGGEVTEGGSLRDLALHGWPQGDDTEIQAGAVPFLHKKGVLHIVLITNSSGSRWIIPKGRLEAHLTPQEVALMEAAEEAGAIGRIEEIPLAPCRTEDGRLLRLYPLRVATLLPQWPERLQRRRVVLPVYRALLRLSDPGLIRTLRELSRLLPS